MQVLTAKVFSGKFHIIKGMIVQALHPNVIFGVHILVHLLHPEKNFTSNPGSQMCYVSAEADPTMMLRLVYTARLEQ